MEYYQNLWLRGGLPSNTAQFLTTDEAIEIHAVLISRFGGPPGARDLGLLESALYLPRSGYYADLIKMAAAMFESLIKNHPFVDGNKRAAFSATDVFLRLNGYKFEVEAKAAHRFLINLFETNDCDLGYLRPWMSEFVTKI